MSNTYKTKLLLNFSWILEKNDHEYRNGARHRTLDGEAMLGHYNHLQCRYMLSAYLHNDQETEVACAEQAYLDVGKILSDHFTYHAADCT